MISLKQVRTIFAELLPDDVIILFTERRQFIKLALQHPYIQAQIKVGIYDQENIYTDFLSPVRSYTELRFTEICYDLLADHCEGLDDSLVENYLRHIAVHEAHHFHEAHVPESLVDHHEAEAACIAAMEAKYPELGDAMTIVGKTSPVYVRVYRRIERIERERTQQPTAPALP